VFQGQSFNVSNRHYIHYHHDNITLAAADKALSSDNQAGDNWTINCH
jgi:hypothetical protein